jgi:3-hydroxyisobutyrate dehydrogenase
MGQPMAANLAREGFSVQSYDRNGSGNCKSAREAANGADALITMLPDGEVVREAVLDALPGLPEGAVVIDMSSSDPAGTRALAKALEAKRIAMIDAPVSGAVVGARDGTLAIMAGGDASVFEKTLPLLRAMGKDIFHVGPVGAGHAVKALNNYLGAAGTLAGFEALLVARAFGLDPEPMLKAINASTGHNYTTERKIPKQVLTGAFASGFKLGLMTKDIGIAAELAHGLRVPTPFLEKTLQLFRDAMGKLPADADHTQIYNFLAKLPKQPRAARRKTAPSRAVPGRRSNLRRKRRRST